MSRVNNDDPERANVAGVLSVWLDIGLVNSRTCKVDIPHNQPPPVMTRSSQDTNFGDSSGPLFSMYSKISEEEDNKMAELWQKEAGDIIIFVGPEPEAAFHAAAN